jgi:hypothetical protein
MKFIDVDQNSDEWRWARLGMPTASNFHLIITPLGKAVDSKERKKYLYRLVAERIMRMPMPSDFEGNEHTERGLELEPRAASALEARLGITLDGGGFCIVDKGSLKDRVGCSPDRIARRLGDTQSVEIKCPAAWTHIMYMVEGPGERYKPQVQGQILIGGFTRCHFWSYHPSFAPVHVVTEPDTKFIDKLGAYLELFCNDLDQTEAWVRRHGNVEEIVKEAVAE